MLKRRTYDVSMNGVSSSQADLGLFQLRDDGLCLIAWHVFAMRVFRLV